MTLGGGRINITALSPLSKSRNADELGRALKQDVQDFLDGGDFTDDFTLVIVEAEG